MEIGSVRVGKYLGEKAALMKPSLPVEDKELKKRTARVAGSDIIEQLAGMKDGGKFANCVLGIGWWLVAGGGEKTSTRRIRVTCNVGHVILVDFLFHQISKDNAEASKTFVRFFVRFFALRLLRSPPRQEC